MPAPRQSDEGHRRWGGNAGWMCEGVGRGGRGWITGNDLCNHGAESEKLEEGRPNVKIEEQECKMRFWYRGERTLIEECRSETKHMNKSGPRVLNHWRRSYVENIVNMENKHTCCSIAAPSVIVQGVNAYFYTNLITLADWDREWLSRCFTPYLL